MGARLVNTSQVPTLHAYLTAMGGSAGISATDRAIVENFRWEERVGQERLRRYGSPYEGASIGSMGDV